tara:strand:- start:15149 stop:16054 length:906 start_codon:yes stop_codon:yes gene_type:complete
MPGERKVDLHFRMLDSRNKARIKYEKVNADTGEEVPWKEIVKAFEYSKGNYVVLEPEDIGDAAPQSKESIDVEGFVDADAIRPEYFEKPYILVPNKKAEKGYVLLRDTLFNDNKVGIARVVIRTREYLCAVLPKGPAIVLNLLRYQQEIVDLAEYSLPQGEASEYRISKQEMDMARQLIASMTGEWKPEQYKDEFRHRLTQVIKKRMKANSIVDQTEQQEGTEAPENAATNVVDFMALLRKSLSTNKRTPPKAAASPVKKVSRRKTTKAAKAIKKATKSSSAKAAKKTSAKSRSTRNRKAA